MSDTRLRPEAEAITSADMRNWARQDSNLGPRDYESPALTAELQARRALTREHPTSNVQRPIFS